MLRVDDQRFEGLPDYPFAPHYFEWENKRIHYVDEGEGEETILCLHGEPTWSFLYRHLIAQLSTRHRVVAPDFIGFGKSDKLGCVEDYTFELHTNTILATIERLDLRDITLVVHDWGGLTGLWVAAHYPDYFKRLVILNTALPTGDHPYSPGFMKWRRMVERERRALNVSEVMRRALPPVKDEVIAGYAAPFPDERYVAGAVAWPLMIPLRPEDPVAPEMLETRQLLTQWDKPTLIMFSEDDPVLGGADRLFAKIIRHAQNYSVKEGGHFLQETQSALIAEQMEKFLDSA